MNAPPEVPEIRPEDDPPGAVRTVIFRVLRSTVPAEASASAHNGRVRLSILHKRYAALYQLTPEEALCLARLLTQAAESACREVP